MPININGELPAAKTLLEEGIFLMTNERAQKQNIRPLRIAILNLMPTKVATETQLLRLLSNTPLQIEIVLLHPATHISKNVSAEYLNNFYKTFDEVKDQKFDGLIITGAPVEQLPFEQVTYWKELTKIMDWSKNNVYSTLHICWGAQAGLYYRYGIDKHIMEEKLFGVFQHKCHNLTIPLMRGFNEYFSAPHSRYTTVNPEDIEKNPNLEIICDSKESGVYIVVDKKGRNVFVMGHPEYDKDTLKKEYLRDIEKGLDIKVPYGYFVDNDPSKEIIFKWRAHASLLFINWLNYYVYQATPYDLSHIKHED